MSRIVAVLVAAAIPLAGGAGSSSASMPPSCRTSQLRIRLTHTGAVTGVEGGYLRFANRGRVECRLSGWPTAVAVEASGKAVEARRAVHGTMIGAWTPGRPLALTLRPGSSAYAVIEDGDNPVQNPTAPCPTARWLRVAPPGDVRRVTLSAWLPNDLTYLPLCTAFDGSPELEVSTVVPLTNLAH
jgi:Domain of unknown function (DUF4232)